MSGAGTSGDLLLFRVTLADALPVASFNPGVGRSGKRMGNKGEKDWVGEVISEVIWGEGCYFGCFGVYGGFGVFPHCHGVQRPHRGLSNQDLFIDSSWWVASDSRVKPFFHQRQTIGF